MAWQNWSILKHNSVKCTSDYYSKPLFGFLLTNIDYIIPFYIMGFMGIVQNLLAIQTLVTASFQDKWGTVYRLAYSMNGLFISICLMISVFWNHGFSLIIGLACLNHNSISLWISAILAFERMLMDICFFKLYGMGDQHAVVISVLIVLFVTASYVFLYLFSQLSSIIFYFHLIGPGIIHTVSFVITCASIFQRGYYLSENTMNFSSFMQICSNYRGFVVAPLVHCPMFNNIDRSATKMFSSTFQHSLFLTTNDYIYDLHSPIKRQYANIQDTIFMRKIADEA